MSLQIYPCLEQFEWTATASRIGFPHINKYGYIFYIIALWSLFIYIGFIIWRRVFVSCAPMNLNPWGWTVEPIQFHDNVVCILLQVSFIYMFICLWNTLFELTSWYTVCNMFPWRQNHTVICLWINVIAIDIIHELFYRLHYAV